MRYLFLQMKEEVVFLLALMLHDGEIFLAEADVFGGLGGILVVELV